MQITMHENYSSYTWLWCRFISSIFMQTFPKIWCSISHQKKCLSIKLNGLKNWSIACPKFHWVIPIWNWTIGWYKRYHSNDIIIKL
jgi:hypothetical protein